MKEHGSEVSSVPSAKEAVAYRFLFEIGNAGMLLATADGTVLEANPEACRLLGRTGEEVLGARLDQLFDFSDPQHTLTVGAQTTFRGGLRLLRNDGSFLPVDAAMASYREEGEGRIGVCFREVAGKNTGLEKAIVELEKSRQRLAASERLFRVTFDQAAVGMAHVAPDGRWLRVNDKLCQNVGYNCNELYARTFQDITHPDDLEKDLEQARRILAGEIDSYRMEKRYVRKDGSIVRGSLNRSIIREPSGEPNCFISVIEDITERKLKEIIPDPLTPRELEVLSLIARWQTNEQIAKELNYSLGTASGRCTLRAAVQETNALAGADVINLPAGTYLLTIAGRYENAATTGDLDITDPAGLSIAGAGQASTIIDAGQIDRVLHAPKTTTLEVRGIKITGGDAKTSDPEPDSNGRLYIREWGYGGGLYIVGELALEDSTLSNNIAEFYGGGIYAEGNVTINRGTFSSNASGGHGGGVHVRLGDLTVSDSTFTDNTAKGDGGGIGHNDSNNFVLKNSMIRRQHRRWRWRGRRPRRRSRQ